MKIYPGIAQLSADHIRVVQALEKKIGVIMVAYEPVPEIARLTGEQVEDLKLMEKKTGTVVVAYKA
jgi:hypothetical protein